jgi:steroid 5-alpha reductase family enzyme
MKTISALLFGAGLLLAVRVMFFGVRRTIDLDTFTTRAWPLSVATVMAAAGSLLFLQVRNGAGVTGFSVAVVGLLSALAGWAAWWAVRLSVVSAERSPDPEEDPRYRFQGHVAQVVSAIRDMQSLGRIALVIDGRKLEFAAKWLEGTTASAQDGSVDREVVIERVDGDVAFVEPWALVESRL